MTSRLTHGNTSKIFLADPEDGMMMSDLMGWRWLDDWFDEMTIQVGWWWLDEWFDEMTIQVGWKLSTLQDSRATDRVQQQ